MQKLCLDCGEQRRSGHFFCVACGQHHFDKASKRADKIIEAEATKAFWRERKQKAWGKRR